MKLFLNRLCLNLNYPSPIQIREAVPLATSVVKEADKKFELEKNDPSHFNCYLDQFIAVFWI